MSYKFRPNITFVGAFDIGWTCHLHDIFSLVLQTSRIHANKMTVILSLLKRQSNTDSKPHILGF